MRGRRKPNSLLQLSSPVRVEHFGRWLRYISFNGGMRSRWHVARARRTISAISRGRRYDGCGAGNWRYAAGIPVLGLRQGQIFVGDAACRRIAISRSVKTLSSGCSLKAVAAAAGGKVSILTELMIVLAADRIAIVAALNRFRNQILVDGALRVLIAVVAATAVNARRRFGRR